MNVRLLIYFSFFILLLSSCRKDLEKPRWNSQILTPLIKTSLGLENIVRDNSITENSEGLITIVDRRLLYSLSLDSILSLGSENFPQFYKNVKLSTLSLAPQTMTRYITLGEIARALQAQGDPMGDFLINYHGQTVPYVPPISDLSAGPFDLDANQFFQVAELDSGWMDITIFNRLPLNIQRVEFDLKNKNLGTVIASEVFTNIAPNSSKSTSIDMTGTTVEGNMQAEILDMDLGDGAFVRIDTNDYVSVTLHVHGLKVYSATAVFPAQDVVSERSEVQLLNMGDIELTEAGIKSGYVKIDVVSTAQDNIYFNYKIPSAKKNGVPFETNTIVPPAPPGGNVQTSFLYDFEGFVMDLTGDPSQPDTVNTFYNELTGRIEYTGKVVSLSLNDSLEVTISLINVTPSFVKGYLGSYTANAGPENVPLDLFSRIEGGMLNFEEVKILLHVENGIGAPGRLTINNIQAMHPQKSPVTLSSSYIGQNISIPPATYANPIQPSHTSLDFSGSNAVDLINLMPHHINYHLAAVSNPYGKTGLNDFAYDYSPLQVFMDMELPLSVLAEDLALSDTIDFLSKTLEASIQNGKLNIVAENGFPLNADLKMYFLNSNHQVVDSLISFNSLLAATLNGTGRVSQPKESVISFSFDQTKLNNILSSSYITFKVKFNTMPSTQHVKIYSDYRMDVKITGDMTVSYQKK